MTFTRAASSKGLSKESGWVRVHCNHIAVRVGGAAIVAVVREVEIYD